MLQNYFLPQLEQLNLKHDEGSCHFSLQVRKFLNWEYSNKWIGRGIIFFIANEGEVMKD